jgi:hypothetical protein
MADALVMADLVRILEETPKARSVAERALLIHARHEREPIWLGFAWDELGIPGVSWSTCSQLTVSGLLERSYNSRAFTYYKLRDPQATELALRATLEEQVTAAPYQPPPADLFDIIVGLDRAKWVSRLAVEAAKPAAIGYVGPPGSAKTEFLLELARLPGARMVTGGATSRVGIEDMFLDGPPPRFLLYDELEKAPAADAAVLLSLAQDGSLRVTKHRRTREWRGLVSIFTTCNRLPDREELVDRFTWLRLAAYTEDEFHAVCFNYLTRREGLDHEQAGLLAALCAPLTRSVRRVRDIARLSGGDRKLASELVQTLLVGTSEGTS